MTDMSTINAADITKIIGSDANGVETTPAKVSSYQDLGTSDVCDTAAVDTLINLTTSWVPARVGASNLTNRKLIQLEAKTVNVEYGYSNRVFSLKKDQIIILPLGPNITVYVRVSTSTGSIAVGEMA